MRRVAAIGKLQPLRIAVETAVRAWEVSVGRDAKGDIFHGFQTAVIDRQGTIVSRWYGAGIDVKRLTADAVAAAR